jgi:DNA-binding XRE family transcriptional regulator
MTPTKTTKSRKGFDQLRKQIDADPTRRAKVEKHKTAMLSELRRKLDLTQAIVADRLDVTQENVSQIERGEADVRLVGERTPPASKETRMTEPDKPA